MCGTANNMKNSVLVAKFVLSKKILNTHSALLTTDFTMCHFCACICAIFSTSEKNQSRILNEMALLVS